MNEIEIEQTLKTLARCQGGYGRLLENINKNPRRKQRFLKELAKLNFKDAVDLVLYLEA
jgi:hypothetical protein